MDRTDIETMVRRWTQEAIAEGRLDVFDELLAQDVVDRSGATPTVGVESFKVRAAGVRAAFPISTASGIQPMGRRRIAT